MLKSVLIIYITAIFLYVSLCADAKGEVTCNLSEPEGTYFPHQNCSKFYVCDHDQLTELECPPSLYFNPELDVCDFPINVPECVGGTREPGTSNPPTPPISTTSETIPTTSASTTPSSTTSVPTIPTTTTLSTTQCTTTVCSSTTPTTTVPSTTTPTTTTPWTTRAPTTSPISSTPAMPNNCPASGIDKIPHPSLPDRYIICVNGVAYEVHCPDGLNFNPIEKKCDFPENENSTTTPGPLPPSTTPSPPHIPQCPPEGTSFLPLPGNCSFYVLCAEGFGLVQKCVDGTCFNEEHSKCEPEADADSPLSPELDFSMDSICKDNNEDVLLYPSKNSCKQYHICLGVAYKGRQECGKGKHFHYFTQNCIPKEFSDCKNVYLI